MENKFAFQAKKRQKNGFFGVFRSALKRFGIVLYDFDEAQTHRLAFQLDAQVFTTIETEILAKSCVPGQKTSKKWFLWGLQVFIKTLRILIL